MRENKNMNKIGYLEKFISRFISEHRETNLSETNSGFHPECTYVCVGGWGGRGEFSSFRNSGWIYKGF